MEEPTVTISLKDYNELKEKSMIISLMLDKIMFFEHRMRDMDEQIQHLRCEIQSIKINKEIKYEN
jgi:outer membrane lipoprotein-sorting protein